MHMINHILLIVFLAPFQLPIFYSEEEFCIITGTKELEILMQFDITFSKTSPVVHQVAIYLYKCNCLYVKTQTR